MKKLFISVIMLINLLFNVSALGLYDLEDINLAKSSRIKNSVIISRVYGGWGIHILSEGYMFIPYDDFMKDYEENRNN